MARSSGLGKGLSSIIPGAELPDADASQGAVLSDVPVSAVSPNPNQPRVHFDEESLTELSASITEMGVLQPILVRPLADGAFELIAGERRWRAAQRAGLTTIPAVIRLTDDVSSVEQALVENLHRQDLTALEEAAAFQQLLDEFGLTHDQVATRVGKSRSAITNSLRLLGLPPAVQHLLADGQLSAGHARALLGTPDRSRQEQLAREAATGGWSVRMVEDAVRADIAGPDDVDATVADDEVPAATPVDGAGLTPSTRLRPPGLLGTRAPPGRAPRHARERSDDRQEGSGDHRVRRPRGSRTHLPSDDQLTSAAASITPLVNVRVNLRVEARSVRPRSVVRTWPFTRRSLTLRVRQLNVMSRRTHRLCASLWTTQKSGDEPPVAHNVRAPTTASVTASVASTAARTGPSEHSTAGMRVSRSTGRRMPRTSGRWSCAVHHPAAMRVANARPPIDSNVGTA